MKTYQQFNENKDNGILSNVGKNTETYKNGCTVFLKSYFKFENVYKHIDMLDDNRIDYDISYWKNFIKIDAYAYLVSEYRFLMSIDFKVNRNIQDIINPKMSLDKIRSIVKSDEKWKSTSKEELPYLNDINKFNL